MRYHGVIDTLEAQFLSCYSVNSIDWQQIAADISWQDQKHLIDRTYSHKMNKQYPINTKYQLSFFKKLIHRLEQLGLEIHDEIYEAFCHLQVVSGNEERFAYKHYSLAKYNTVFTLKESRSFATDGTTGLCSWQASLALSDWLLHNPDVVRDKSIIELGSGTGLCGFIVLRCCKAKAVTLTDGSTVVVDMLNTNRKLNFPDEIGDHEKLSIIHLPWEACELVPQKKFDVILAADVVYDSSELGNLVAAIDNIFRLMEDKVKLVIAATVRNEETLGEFIELLDLINFSIKDEEVVPLKESNLFWDRSTQVRIMTVTRNTSSLN